MRTTKKIIIAFLAVFMITACDEDFLDLHPPYAISADEAFETLDDFYSGLNGIYSALRGGGGYWGKNMMMNFAVATDEAYAVEGFTNQWGGFYNWAYTAGTSEIAGLWINAYRVSTRASNLIENHGDLTEGSRSERNQILGEAKLLRAMAHFDLVRVFAKPYKHSNPSSDLGVPIVTVENIEDKPRETIADVYNFILEEAHEALDLLNTNRAIYYMGVDAANAFLARVYQEMGDWENAAEYAGEAIGSRQLAEGQDYLNVWRRDGHGNGEVIFLCGVVQAEFTNGLNLGSNFVGSTPPAGGNWRIDYKPGVELVELYDRDNDIRYEAFFEDDVAIVGYEAGLTVLVKYYHDNPNFEQRGMNQMKVFRLSEMYLIKAEALAELGEEADANQYLADLRDARIQGYSHTDYSGDELLEEIYKERQLELAFEGHRWFDLRRRGEGFERVPQVRSTGRDDITIEPDNHRWIYPIPQGEMDANRLMVQNPGY